MSGPTPALSDAAVRQLQEIVDLPDAGDRFVVHELLGEGGMGRVYRVTDQLLQRDVALKVLRLDGETPEFAARLARESRVLARLEHPGIAAIHDAGTLVDGRPFYLMRLVRGRSLTDAHTLGTRGERLRLFVRICDAVAYAHAQGIVHRDITPGNVMLGEFGDVVVVDWGIAKVLHGRTDVRDRALACELPALERLPTASRRADADTTTDTATQDGIVIGTPGFMAPEQASGSARDTDVRSDVFSLGALLGHLMTHRDAAEHGELPRPLAAIIARAAATEPAARYATVEALSNDVRAWLDAAPVSAYRENPFERAARVYARNRTLVLLLLAYAVMRLAILAWRGV